MGGVSAVKKLSVSILLINLYTIGCMGFLYGCASELQPIVTDKDLQQEIESLRKIYVSKFNSSKVVFEGIEVIRDEKKINDKIKSVSYYYINAKGKKIQHGLARYYRDGNIFFEEIMKNGIPDDYIVCKLGNKDLAIIFKNNRPWKGIFPLPTHNKEFLGIYFSDGNPYKMALFNMNGEEIETYFDLSGHEQRDGQPWNGDFLSLKDKKIDKYLDGKVISRKDCEILNLLNDLLTKVK